MTHGKKNPGKPLGYIINPKWTFVKIHHINCWIPNFSAIFPGSQLIGDDTTYYFVWVVIILLWIFFAFLSNRMGSLRVCIPREPTKGIYFQGQSMSGFLVFRLHYPLGKKPRNHWCKMQVLRILETGHGNEEFEQIDTCAQTHAKTKQIHAFTGAIRVYISRYMCVRTYVSNNI